MDCPEFEYERVDGHRAVLAERVAHLLARLRRGQVETRDSARDTRPAHGEVFGPLAPRRVAHYAGHYRGEDLPCLRDYQVRVAGDPRVGTSADRVLASMSGFGDDVGAALNALDSARDLRLPEAQKLNCMVVVACRLLERFLAIHPYANGNGHMGRYIVWLVLGRYGYWPDDWPVEPRPPDPPYTEFIVRARNGERHLLEQFVLGCIRGRPLSP